MSIFHSFLMLIQRCQNGQKCECLFNVDSSSPNWADKLVFLSVDVVFHSFFNVDSTSLKGAKKLIFLLCWFSVVKMDRKVDIF